MRNENYWANRIKIAQDKTLDRIYDEYVANIERQYNRAILDIEKDILAWYQRFADNNELSFADAQKLLKSDELEEFKWTVQEYIEKGKENGISADWAKELENASARVHISRLESLKYQLRAHAEELTQGRIKNTAEASELAFTEGYYHTAYEFQKEIGVGFSLQSIDRVKLEKILNKPWTTDNQTFTARCWTDKARLVEAVNQELTRMVATGAAPKKAIENISKQFGTSKTNAGRVIMTESAYFATASQGECYKDLGVDDYEVIGTLDKGMCDFCGEMDGKVFPVNKMQAGSTAPPFHPWCRCTTAPYYEDMVGVGQRFARDKDGKTYTVPSDMTYAEWKEIYVNKTSTKEEWMENRVDKTAKNGIINIRADEFVPCLKDTRTGEILQTDIRDIQRSDLLKYNRKTGWYLDWKKDTPKDQHVLGLFLKDDTEAQGLISIRHDEGGTFMAFAEAAPHNNKYLTGNQKYIGVGGHLVAAAIKESVMNGNGGCVYGYAADQRLLEHFIKDFGAAHYPFSHPYQFVIEGKAAQKVLDIYTFERK